MTDTKLTETQEEALAWFLEKQLGIEIHTNKEAGHVSWAENHPAEYKANLRRSILSDNVDDKLLNIERQYKTSHANRIDKQREANNGPEVG